MNTYSQALQNYHLGKIPDTYEIIRDDGYSSTVPVSVFFDHSSFDELELSALDSCAGKTLDVGAGAGRHSIELQRRKVDVTAVDISENAVNIMKDLGVERVIHSDIMDLSKTKFDTLLMLMNGIGMVGKPENLERFFKASKELLTKNGVIIFDSIDVSKTIEPIHVKYRELNILNNKPPGQQKLKINYAGTVGEWFHWLHISFNDISSYAERHGYSTELIAMEDGGQYVAKLKKG
jgi:2-polyprenyl-3-methyl-5-hydroxy-6-metoxy-1,4-benzoquinol methylase